MDMGWIILLPVVLIVEAAFLFTGLSAAKANKGRVLGVSLPQKALGTPELAGLVAGYRKGMLLHSLLFLLAALPLPLLERHSLWMLGLFLLWTTVYLLTFNQVFSRWAGKLKELKTRQGWGTRETANIIAVDTQVVSGKGRMPLSPLWMLPALALSCAPLLSCLFGEAQEDLYFLAGVILTLHGVFWLVRRFMARGRSTAYCADPDVNRACHYLALRTWSVCWTVTASAFALFMDVAFFLLRRGTGEGYIVLLVVPLAITLAATFYADWRIRRGQNRLLEGQPPLETGDEDRYWTRSGFYNNPLDPRIMVEKRWGIGGTINIGHPVGRLLGWGLIAFVGLLLAWMLTMLVWMELAPFRMEIADGTVSVSAPFYGTSFSVEEIESVALSDTIPTGSKTNGMATGSTLLGQFRLEEVGPARLYVRTEDMPCLVIRLPGETVYFTGETAEETLELYNALAP